MTVYLIKKERGRVYKSADIVRSLWGLELSHDDEGAPVINGSSPEAEGSGDLFITISDTSAHWACCIEDHPIGLDMEESSRKPNPKIAKKLHPDEQAYLAALSEGSSEWNEEFLSVWTRKEAWMKYKGKGIKLGLSSFSVMDGSIEGVPVSSFTAKGIVFGIAGAENASVELKRYDAPMEKSALDYAAGLLDVKGYTSAQLSKKLRDKGYGAEETAEALEKLKDYGYVNDEAYAQSFVRRGSESGKSSRRVEMELRQKGLDRESARSAAGELKEGDYKRALREAEKLLEKLGGIPAGGESEDYMRARNQKVYGKVSRKLSALGYEASVIYSVMDELFK